MNDIFYTVAHRSQDEIDSFKNRYQIFKTELIPEIFKKALDYDVIDWKQSNSWGSSHVIYFVRTKQITKPLVLRANIGYNQQPEYVMKVEEILTKKVKKIGVPTNILIYSDISRKEFPFDYQIQEMLEGYDTEKDFKGTQKEYDKISYDLGRYIAIYSGLHFPGFGRFDEQSITKGILKGEKTSLYEYMIVCLDDDIDFIIKENIINNIIGKNIRKLFEDYKLIFLTSENSLVHHDLADHNIFSQGDRITGIFDWEAAVVADSTLDLASSPTWRTIYPREKIIINGFRSVRKLPEYFEEKMNIFRLRTMMWKARYAIRMKIMNEGRKQKFLDALTPFGLNK
jgi:hypothetical protein